MLIQNAESRKKYHRKTKKNYYEPGPVHRTYIWMVELLSRMLGLYRISVNQVGGGTAQRVGVMNTYYKNLLVSVGVDEKKISVVGSVDFSLARKMHHLVTNNSTAKKDMARKHGINLDKKNIAIFTEPFHTQEIDILSDEEQLNRYRTIIAEIRGVFGNEEADIHLKIHPRETLSFYKPLIELGVSLHDRQTSNEELIALSDLYIASCSTTNFIPIVMEKDCLFINLLDMHEGVETTKEEFGIKQFVHTKKELNKKLTQFKHHALPKQYALDALPTGCTKKILTLIEG